MTTIYIKNMVCDRCKMAVNNTLTEMDFHPISVELGVAQIEEAIDDQHISQLKQKLEALGFELLDDKRQQIIDKIRAAIIQLVHYDNNYSNTNLSDYLAEQLHMEYSQLSKLFSEVTGMTIERYHILQRIERVKELICYDELSLTQIALQLNYSSTAYLSAQFKNITGMTPSQFKALNGNKRQALDKLG